MECNERQKTLYYTLSEVRERKRKMVGSGENGGIVERDPTIFTQHDLLSVR